VLLIAAVLAPEVLKDLPNLIWKLGMEALMEVHDGEELDRVLLLNPQVIGINNRDLRTFHVDLKVALSLRSRIPSEVLVASESGVRRPQDVHRLALAGVDAVLVGEALVTAEGVDAIVRGLVSAGAGVACAGTWEACGQEVLGQ